MRAGGANVGELVNTRAMKTAQRIAEKAHRTAAESTKRMFKVGQIKVKHAARAVGNSVNKNPWGYIAGFAAGAAAIGYLFGKKRHVGLKELLTA